MIGSLIGTDMRIGIVVARFNELVTRLLLAGALESLGRHGVADADVQVSSDIRISSHLYDNLSTRRPIALVA